jgi:hypothetical protein
VSALTRPSALIALAVCLAASSASAQDEAAQAEALLEQGRALMHEGKAEEACPKFAESQRVAPSSAALVSLGDCYLKLGKKASAWVTFKEAMGSQTERERYAREKVAELEPKLARITIVVTPATDAPGLLLKRNGVDVDRAEWGTAIPVDPGTYAFEASASGKKTWTSTLTITDKSRDESVVLPTLEDVGHASAPRPRGTIAAGRAPESPAEPSSWPAQRTTALIVGGVGVAAVGVGSVFGLVVLGNKSDANAHCPTVTTCDAQGFASGQDAHSAATLSTVLFVAGGAALGAGAILWFTSPSGSKQGHVALDVGPRAVGLEGSW